MSDDDRMTGELLACLDEEPLSVTDLYRISSGLHGYPPTSLSTFLQTIEALMRRGLAQSSKDAQATAVAMRHYRTLLAGRPAAEMLDDDLGVVLEITRLGTALLEKLYGPWEGPRWRIIESPGQSRVTIEGPDAETVREGLDRWRELAPDLQIKPGTQVWENATVITLHRQSMKGVRLTFRVGPRAT